uniref:Uncharacterized protein n=1 Tax=Moniliophthora roreri TaxID=221103 RepID=A0A0W0FRK7_MONRR
MAIVTVLLKMLKNLCLYYENMRPVVPKYPRKMYIYKFLILSFVCKLVRSEMNAFKNNFSD